MITRQSLVVFARDFGLALSFGCYVPNNEPDLCHLVATVRVAKER